MKHVNIPIFVPHLGCPNTCVFCNQHTITGKQSITLSEFDNTVRAALATLDPAKHAPQIAFFGGSFTAIDRDHMIALLEKASGYVNRGEVTSIRLSTRPDAIDQEILTLLQKNSVKAIELGIQSTDEAVLCASQRGHSKRDSENACGLIKEYGFELVGQMMLGLPLSTAEIEKKTAYDMISWGIDSSRIYPTVVFQNTALSHLMQSGIYSPLSLEDAVQRGADVYRIFCEHRVEVIRMGLCETEDLRGSETLGGAYHPAFGDLVINRYFLKKILSAIEKITLPPNATITVEISPTALSQAIGQKRSNLHSLEKKFPDNRFLFRPSPELSGKEVKITIKEN